MAAMALVMCAVVINEDHEAMMSIGCIQAQKCHTNKCPTGVATQSKWLQNGINVALKSSMNAQYFKTFRKELIEITHACGYEHPCQFTMEDIEVNADDINFSQNISLVYNYQKDPVPFLGISELKNCEYLGGKD